MPKAKSTQERITIKNRLMDVAEELLMHRDMRKITIDDLVYETKIAKGTFYLFYDSKELLIYDVFRRRHDEIQHRFLLSIENRPSIFGVNEMTELVFLMVKELKSSFLMNFAMRGDLEVLMRSLPPEQIQDHLDQDLFSMRQLHDLFPSLSDRQMRVYTAAIRIALVSVMHQNEIGIDEFEDALHCTLKGIIQAMFEGNHHD